MRDTQVIIISGMQNSGKTYLSFKHLLYTAYGDHENRRKSLIVDVNNEYGSKAIDGVTHEIDLIGIDDVLKYGQFPGACVKRINFFNPDGSTMSVKKIEQMIIRICDEFRNGILYLEDINRTFDERIPREISGALVNVRHRGTDLMMAVQSIGRCTPKILQNAKLIRMHRQLDSIEKSKLKLAGEDEIFYIAEKIINKQCLELGNKYYCLYVDREMKKIKGAFSNRAFTEAIQEYLSENKKRFKSYLDKRDVDTGKLIYNYNSALMVKTKDLFLEYHV